MTPLARLHAWVENMWWQEGQPPVLLRWCSHAYGRISEHRLERRHQSAQTPPLPLISVGNITAGGSGKTPFVMWLVNELKARHYKPVVLNRGDGGRQREPKILSESDDAPAVGDEARLLFETCHCPVIAGHDRVAASRMATSLGDVIILDDGFQYRQLKRQCDIVLVPAEGIGNGCLIPAGPLREPLASLSRANVIVRSGRQSGSSLGFGKEWHWHTKAGRLEQARGPKAAAPARVMAVCGIARPHRFVASLKDRGIEVSASLFFPDHHRFSHTEVQTMLASDYPVAITAKDAVKLLPIWPEDVPLWILEQEGDAEEGLLDAILAHILAPG